MNSNVKTTKYQLVELQVPAAATAGQRIYFQDQPQLRSQSGRMTLIESVETFSDGALALSPFSSLPTATPADITNGILVLNIAGYEDLQGVPLAVLNRVIPDAAAYAPGVYDLFLTNDLYRVDWTKSYVQLQAAPSGNIAYLFGVRYAWVVGKQ